MALWRVLDKNKRLATLAVKHHLPTEHNATVLYATWFA